MVLQLTLLGYVLVPVVKWGAWWLVLLTSAAMVAVNSVEAVSRPAFTYKVLWPGQLKLRVHHHMFQSLLANYLVNPSASWPHTSYDSVLT